MERKYGNGKSLRLVVGDITTIPVDAIVNAANSQLRGGGGVDGAIHRAGGPSLMRELDQIRREGGGCPTGSAVVTGAGLLPARFVIHAVGPIYQNGQRGEPDELAGAYRTSLQLAEERGVKSISFPAISAGVYGYPAADAAQIAIQTVASHLSKPEAGIAEILLVSYNPAMHAIYTEVLANLGAG